MTKEQPELLKIKEDLSALKLKAFNSQMNPHFVFNALNAIQYFITSENKKQALKYLSVFSKLIRFYLKHLENETVQLEEEIKMLHWYLQLQKLRYNDEFNYVINIDETSKKKNAIIPSFITQTLLENSIEFALYNQFKNNKFMLTFIVTEKEVVLNFIHEYNKTNKQTTKRKPEYRTQIIKWQNQIQLLNRILPYNIKKNIILSDTQNLKGTTISISLPNLK